MQKRARRYHIRLKHGDGTESVIEVHAQTTGQAVGMAEAEQSPGTHAISADVFLEFAGRCCKCHNVVESWESFKIIKTRVVCSDCSPVGLR